MNRAQRRQMARNRPRSQNRAGAPIVLTGMSTDIARDMEAAVRTHQSGNLARAAELYQSVLKRCPDQPDALHLLGVILGDSGQPDKAIELIDRALKLDRRNAVYHNNRGNLLRQAGDVQESIASYRRAIKYAPDYAIAHNNLGIALNGRRQNEKAEQCFQRSIAAEQCFRRALAADPAYFDAYNNLGTSLYIQKRLEEAETVFRDAIRIAPTQLSAHTNLANVLVTQGCFEEAVTVCRAALEIDANHGPSLTTLARLHEAQGQFTEAEEIYRSALDLHPDSPALWNNFGNLLRATLRFPEAGAAFHKALEIGPATSGAHSNLLFFLGFDPEISSEDILAQARRWNERYAAPLTERAQHHPNSRIIERPLRVGYVSPDFRDHAVGRFLSPLFEAHDRSHFEIYAYADVGRPDARTEWFERHTKCWRNIFKQSDALVAQQIRDDGIDVLIDLAGHTAGNRLLSFAERPAPVQASWLGYGGSTGMDAMGWYISDAQTDPPGAETHYCERLIRLPQSLFCYQPEPDAPPVSTPPAIKAGYVTFGSFNNLTKVNGRAIARWAEILSRTPGSRMVIKGRGLDETTLRARFLDVFAACDVSADRLDFIGYQKDTASHLALFNRVDMILDTFPYSGATTTFEALWMGLPVVTIAGDRYVARMAAGILKGVGLDELAARDEADYVERAVALATDLPRLQALRESLRERLAASPLCDGPAFAAAMEDAIRHMWRDWCDSNKGAG